MGQSPSPRVVLPVLGLLLAGTLLSCRSVGSLTSPLPDGYPNHTATQVLDRLPTADSLWQRFRIRASLAFATPQGSGSFNADVTVHRPDSVLLRVRAPLGIEVARALITPDSVLVYDRVENTLYAGSVSSGLLPAGLRASDLAVSFFGFDPPAGGSWSIEADSALYRLADDAGTQQLSVLPGIWRITARDVSDAEGTVVERRRYTEFEPFDGRVLPRRIVTIRPVDGTRASFYVRRVEPYPDDRSLDLGLKDDTRRLDIR